MWRSWSCLKLGIMSLQGLVRCCLGHVVSHRGIEIDRAKFKVIEKLLPPTTMKVVRSFFGHGCFHRTIIVDFSKIAQPLIELLAKDASFIYKWLCTSFWTVETGFDNLCIRYSTTRLVLTFWAYVWCKWLCDWCGVGTKESGKVACKLSLVEKKRICCVSFAALFVYSQQ